MSALIALFVLGLIAGGAWIFVETVRRRDTTWFARLGTSGKPKPQSLEELAAQAARSGTIESRLDLADALEELDRAHDAETLYREVLDQASDNLRALHGLARALLSLKRPAQAVEALEEVLQRDRAFRRFAAALDYAEALWQNGQREDTHELLEAMVATTGRMNHRVAQAHYLAAANDPTQAREVLLTALESFETLPFIDRRREQYWAIRAEQMLEELS